MKLSYSLLTLIPKRSKSSGIYTNATETNSVRNSHNWFFDIFLSFGDGFLFNKGGSKGVLQNDSHPIDKDTKKTRGLSVKTSVKHLVYA